MADIQSNIQVNLDATQALSQLKALQRQLAQFHTSITASTASAARAQANLQDNLINSINATGKFSASLQQVRSTSEAFTDSLERNKFSTREYFRYAAGATKTFGRLFKSEFDTIQKVAEERVKTMQTQYVKMGRTANGAIKAIAIRPLTLDMENFSTKMAIAAQKQQLFNQLLTQGSTKLLNFGKNTQWAGRQLMVGFTIPLTMLGVQAGKTFMALEKQAIRFKRVYGEMFTTTDEVDKAFKSIERLAKEFTKYGIAVEKTMEMAADAAATGKMGADLMAQVAEATRLAVLGGVEQQQALETTISLTNAFSISADELSKKINFLNAVENQTVLSIEDLTIAIPKAAPVIKQLGGDVEDLAFFMTAMKEGGINASEGANALKSGLASLINPSKKAKEFLEDFGISIDQIVEKNKGDIKTTVVQFAQALDTLDPLNRARAIEQLFGKFQFSRLSTLFQNITKDGTQASRTLKLTSASVEELAILSERELKKVEDATGTRFKKTLEDLKVSLVPLGEQFLKAVIPIAEFLGKILKSFNNLSDGTKSTITKIVGVVGVLGPVLLMTFGLIANAVANGIKLFVNLRKGFFALSGSSKTLGNQLGYMTSEQIEAATAAASLNQAHSKLKQTFMMEKDSVIALTQAYQRAAAAAQVFARANPGMMRPGVAGVRGRPPVPPMKLNSGGFVTRARGTEKNNTVSTLLTPGEFVVNKQSTKQNKKLLQGINKGGVVPGTGNRDTVPMILDKGSFVVNKKSTRKNKGILQQLNKGKFVKRFVGTWARGLQIAQRNATSLAPMGSFSPSAGKNIGLAQLHLTATPRGNVKVPRIDRPRTRDAISNKKVVTVRDPKTGKLVPFQIKRNSGYTIAGGQGYNGLTNAGSVKGLPEPYPLTLKEAMSSRNKIVQSLNKDDLEYLALQKQAQLNGTKLDPNKPPLSHLLKTMRYKETALIELESDLKQITRLARSPKQAEQAWTNAMADRYATSGMVAEKGRRDVYERLYADFIKIANRGGDTEKIRRRLVANADKLWTKDKFLSDAGAGYRGRLNPHPQTSKTTSDIILQQIAQRKREGKDFSSLLSLMPFTKGKFDASNPTVQAYIQRGFAVPLSKGSKNKFGEPKTVPALVTPGEMIFDPNTTAKHGELLQYINSGGIIKMRNNGTPQSGIVPGIGNKDTVPMMLNQGSFVVNKDSTQKNRKFLNTIATRKDGTESKEKKKKGKVLKSVSVGPSDAATAARLEQERRDREIEKRKEEEEKKALQRKARAAQIRADRAARDLAAAKRSGVSPQVIAKMQQDLNTKMVALGQAQKEAANVGNARVRAQQTRVNAQQVQRVKEEKRKEKVEKRATAAQERKELQKRALKDAGSRFGQRVGGAMMGASMAVGTMAMMPGPLQDPAQKALPAVAMASMLSPMIGSKAGSVVVPLALMTAAMVALTIQFDKAQDAALELGEATGTSTKAIQTFAEFAGRVTGTELMDRQRLAARGKLVAATGKTTFGEAYAQSEPGKALGKAFAENVKNEGSQKAGQKLKSQLATSVMSGALSAEEAQSIAANIGASMGDASIGIQIAGELQGIFGKDGEDITKNGIAIRTKLMTESSERAFGKDGKGGSLKTFKDKTGGLSAKKTTALGTALGMGGGGLAGFAIGSRIGAIAGSLIPVPVLGTLIGTAIGGAIGAGVGYLMKRGQNKQIAQVSGAFAADAKNMFEQSRQLLDSYEAEYKARRRQLLLEGKIKEVKALDLKYEKNRAILVEQQTRQREEFLKAYASTKGNSQARGSLDKALDKQMTSKYKGTEQEVYVGAAKDALNQSLRDKTLTHEQVAAVKMQVNAGELSPRDAMKIFETFKDKDSVQKVFSVLQKFGGDETSAAMDIVSQFQDSQGNVIPELQTKFVTQLEGKTDKEAQKFIEMFQGVTALGGILKLDTEIDYILKNPEAQKEMTKDLQMIADNKGKPFTIEFLNKVNTELDDTMNMEYFKKLSENEKQVYVATIATMLNYDPKVMITDPDFLKWQKEPGPLGGAQYSNLSPPAQLSKYYEAIGQKVTSITADTSLAPSKPTGGGTGGTKQRDTTFDEMNKKLKLFQQASVNALGKFKELQRVMQLPGKKGGAFYEFNGIIQQLARTGDFSAEFMDMVENLSPEELQKQLGKWGIVIDKGVVKTKNAANLINKALSSISAGQMDANNLKEISILENRIIAVNKLRKQGIDYETAMNITASNSIALSIRKGQVDAKRMKELVQSTKLLQKLQMRNEQLESIKAKDPAAKDAGLKQKLLEFFALQTQAVQAGNVVQKTAIELQQEKNGYLLEQINYEQTLINDVYDKQIEKLDTMQKIQEEINQSQRERFDIIQQIASGDMAGAARAIQEARQREALTQIEKRKENLEKERQKKLESVTAGGKTQKQIEQENALGDKNLSVIKAKEFDEIDKLKKRVASMLGMSVEQANALIDIQQAAEDLGIGQSQQLLDFIGQAVFGKTDKLVKKFQNNTKDYFEAFTGQYGFGKVNAPGSFGLPNEAPKKSGLTYLNTQEKALLDNTSALTALTEAIKGKGGKTGSNTGGSGSGSGTTDTEGKVTDTETPGEKTSDEKTPGDNSSKKKSAKKQAATNKKKKGKGAVASNAPKVKVTVPPGAKRFDESEKPKGPKQLPRNAQLALDDADSRKSTVNPQGYYYPDGSAFTYDAPSGYDGSAPFDYNRSLGLTPLPSDSNFTYGAGNPQGVPNDTDYSYRGSMGLSKTEAEFTGPGKYKAPLPPAGLLPSVVAFGMGKIGDGGKDSNFDYMSGNPKGVPNVPSFTGPAKGNSFPQIGVPGQSPGLVLKKTTFDPKTGNMPDPFKKKVPPGATRADAGTNKKPYKAPAFDPRTGNMPDPFKKTDSSVIRAANRKDEENILLKTLAGVTKSNKDYLTSTRLGLKMGGFIKKMFGIGGKVSGPGTSTSDSIPALLSDGEYVVNAASVSKYGVDLFENLNAQKFARGGSVDLVNPGGSRSSAFVYNQGNPLAIGNTGQRSTNNSSALENNTRALNNNTKALANFKVVGCCGPGGSGTGGSGGSGVGSGTGGSGGDGGTGGTGGSGGSGGGSSIGAKKSKKAPKTTVVVKTQTGINTGSNTDFGIPSGTFGSGGKYPAEVPFTGPQKYNPKNPETPVSFTGPDKYSSFPARRYKPGKYFNYTPPPRYLKGATFDYLRSLGLRPLKSNSNYTYGQGNPQGIPNDIDYSYRGSRGLSRTQAEFTGPGKYKAPLPPAGLLPSVVAFGMGKIGDGGRDSNFTWMEGNPMGRPNVRSFTGPAKGNSFPQIGLPGQSPGLVLKKSVFDPKTGNMPDPFKKKVPAGARRADAGTNKKPYKAPAFDPRTGNMPDPFKKTDSSIIRAANREDEQRLLEKKLAAVTKSNKDYLTASRLGLTRFRFNMGGLVPKYFANGGFARGTDTVPAMLTPGEFVVRKSAVDSLGINTMNSINNGELPTSNSVYNYSVSVNVSNTNANPNDIARAVIGQIKQIDSQRIRSWR